MDAVKGIETEQQIAVRDHLMAAKKKRAPPRNQQPTMNGTHENLANGQQVKAQGRYHPYHQPQSNVHRSQPARGTISRPMNPTPDHQRQQQLSYNNVAVTLAPSNGYTEKPLEPIPKASDEIPTEDQEQLILHQMNQPTSSGSYYYPPDYMQNTHVSVEGYNGELGNSGFVAHSVKASTNTRDSTSQISQNSSMPQTPNPHQSQQVNQQQGAAPKKRPRNVLSKEAIEYNAREFARAYGYHDDQPSGAIPRPVGLSDDDLARITEELIADFFIDITAPDDGSPLATRCSSRSEISTPSDSMSGPPSPLTHNAEMITQHVPHPAQYGFNEHTSQNIHDNGVLP